MSTRDKKEDYGESSKSDRPFDEETLPSQPPPRRTGETSQLLASQPRGRSDLSTEVARLNNVVGELHESLQRTIDECNQKEEWGRRLEAHLHDERTRQQQEAAHYTTLLEDKDAQIRELRRCLEAQRFQLSQALENHSRAGQELAKILERERREWAIEREMLQSELNGTQQLIHELENNLQAEVEEAKSRGQSLEHQLEDLKASNSHLREENAELQNLKPSKTLHRSGSFERGVEDNTKEITELKSRLEKFNDRIQDDFDKKEEEMTQLRKQLAEAIEERDKCVTQLHAMKAKELQKRSVRSASISSGGDVMVLERRALVDTHLEELKFELEEERAITQATQENLEDQLRVNRQLELELDQLKKGAPAQAPVRFGRTSGPFNAGLFDQLYRAVIQVQETLDAARTQAANILAKKSSSQIAYHASSLNISIEESRHQVGNLRSMLDSSLEGRSRRSGSLSSFRRQRSAEKRHRPLLSVGSWSLKRTLSSKLKAGKKQEQQQEQHPGVSELDESRKEIVTLMQEKFALEQCVRYLSSRCQMYQTAWKAREGFKKQHRRVASLTGRYEGASSSGASGEIQFAERDEDQPQDIGSLGSGSSPAGESPRLSRTLELQIINKIAQICEPFTTQLSESSSARMLARHRSSREVSSFAS